MKDELLKLMAAAIAGGLIQSAGHSDEVLVEHSVRIALALDHACERADQPAPEPLPCEAIHMKYPCGCSATGVDVPDYCPDHGHPPDPLEAA
jgi:hypothetical protein